MRQTSEALMDMVVVEVQVEWNAAVQGQNLNN